MLTFTTFCLQSLTRLLTIGKLTGPQKKIFKFCGGRKCHFVDGRLNSLPHEKNLD